MRTGAGWILLLAGALGLVVCVDLLAFAPLGDATLNWPWLSRNSARAVLELACAPFVLLLGLGAACLAPAALVTPATLWLLVSLGAGVVLRPLLAHDPALLRGVIGLALAAGALEFLRRNGNVAALKDNMAFAAGLGVTAAFAVPAFLGDPSPARTGLALVLVAAACFGVFRAAAASRDGEPFEVTSWEGGLGGGLRSLRFSKPLAFALLAILLAGASVGVLSIRPAAQAGNAEDKAKSPPKSEKAEPGGSGKPVASGDPKAKAE